MRKAGPKVAILLACHNRRDQTIECIRRVMKQTEGGEFNAVLILVDDGSTDGTAESVKSLFPIVEIIAGDGSLHWNRGMRLAFERARVRDVDFYLMLNDDTYLNLDAIMSLLATYGRVASSDRRESIIVGSTRNPGSDVLSYGGLRCARSLNPAKCRKVEPCDEPQRCDTMNGNCVLIPRIVAQRVGNLDPIFTHTMGDHDYGFRAKRAGCSLWIAPGYIGTCESNPDKYIWNDESLSLHERWSRFLQPKGLPPKEWFVYTWRYSGPLWLLYWMNPYVKFWLNAILILVKRMVGRKT